jgi:polysaccharide export outer membrane protein
MKISILLLVTWLLTACYSYKSIGLLQEDNPKLPVYEEKAFSEYRLKVNDELIFRLISSDETISKLLVHDRYVSGSQNIMSYRIYPDGTIDLPYLKQIPVVGLTVVEAARVVESYYREILPDAAITMALANKNFTVIGEAGSGVYPIYKERLTIYQALSMSGDLYYSGDHQKVRILRETENGTQVLVFDIRPASLINSRYYYIYPNDIIYVQKASSSFWKVNNYGSFIALISSSLTLMLTAFYLFK